MPKLIPECERGTPGTQTHAVCRVCKATVPIADYAWGAYKCKPCQRAYNRAYYKRTRILSRKGKLS